jgi:hypothetical protein
MTAFFMAGEVRSNATRDENRITVLLGVSSITVTVNGINYVAGITPVMVAIDPVTHRIKVEAT